MHYRTDTFNLSESNIPTIEHDTSISSREKFIQTQCIMLVLKKNIILPHKTSIQKYQFR